jgi:NADPH-dependent 2,4-dienoyl-CoA reductase/sulfur reductase-like enzyme/nitrite reductase/ring-hydroxylating ferredoxin subunit
MSDTELPGPDFAAGVDVQTLAEGGMLAGHVDGDEALLVRQGGVLYAVGARCSHYHAALADGLLVGSSLRCPLHHASFDLKSGEAQCAPAFDAIPCWRVERQGSVVFVRERLRPEPRSARAPQGSPRRRIVIVGGGAAGFAAAEMLRREGWDGSLVLISAESDPPCDRPNLSKDFLAGNAPDDWMPLRPPAFYGEMKIDLRLSTHVAAIDLAQRQLALDSGERLPFDGLLLATGATARGWQLPGASRLPVLSLRSWADARRVVAAASGAKSVLVIGASFIGLEAAASLQERGLQVDVLGHGRVPMERILGAELGAEVQAVHAARGTRFHMGAEVVRVDGGEVRLSDGTRLAPDFVLAGVGAEPSLALATQAGLACDRGVLVDAFLETSAAGVFAAGDIARWPDPHSGERIRVEHWTVAQRQGQVAALNLLGRRLAFDAVPFFWSQHHGLTLSMVGHAEKWDSVQIEGSIAAHDAAVTYRLGTRVLALATLSRDRQSLQFERQLELNPAR